MGQKIENNYNSIIEKLRSEQPFTDNFFKLKIFEWVYYSNLRSPVWREFLNSSIVHNNATNKSEAELREEHIQLFYDKEISDYIVKYYSDELSCKRWYVLINSEDLFWISSDNPGFCFNYSDTQENREDFYINPLWTNFQSDTILFYPLSKNYCLKIEPYQTNDDVKLNLLNDSVFFRQANSNEISLINDMTVKTSIDFIYSCNRRELLKYEKIKQDRSRH